MFGQELSSHLFVVVTVFSSCSQYRSFSQSMRNSRSQPEAALVSSRFADTGAPIHRDDLKNLAIETLCCCGCRLKWLPSILNADLLKRQFYKRKRNPR